MLDTLFYNANITTHFPERPHATAMGVHHGRIVSLDNDLPEHLFAEKIDLKGRTVIPGFHDAHLHLTHIGQQLSQVDLRFAAAPSLQAVFDAVAAAAQATPEGQWIVGSGYDQNYLGEHPTADQLDQVAPHHPVILIHASRHMCVANTAAFRAAGYPDRRGIVAPVGGNVPLLPDGRAIGLLEETAQDIVRQHLPLEDQEGVAQLIAAGSSKLAGMGITSIAEPGIGAPDHLGISRVDIGGYQLARATGRLRVRATVMPYLTTLHPIEAPKQHGIQPLGLDLGLRSGIGDAWLKIGPAKILSDGSLIGKSAYMCCDYDGEQGNRGYLQFPDTDLRERIIGAHLGGWQLAVHAIGDAALDVVLDCFEEAQRISPRGDTRHRIEHLSVASDKQLSRLKHLGVVPIPQGRFVHELGDGAIRAMGADRARMTYRVGSILAAGLPLVASTDAPVVDPDPILNLDSLVNRRTATGIAFTPDERISVAQAVHAYTVGSAYSVKREHELGQLAPNFLADFVLLDRDIFTVDPESIAQTRVLATYIGGELVSEAS